VLVGAMARIIMSALQVAGFLIAPRRASPMPRRWIHPEHARRRNGPIS